MKRKKRRRAPHRHRRRHRDRAKRQQRQHKQNSIIEKKKILILKIGCRGVQRLCTHWGELCSAQWCGIHIYMRYIYVFLRLPPLSYIPYTEHRITSGAQTCVFFLHEMLRKMTFKTEDRIPSSIFHCISFCSFLSAIFDVRSTMHLFHFSLLFCEAQAADTEIACWCVVVKSSSRQTEWVWYACAMDTLIYSLTSLHLPLQVKLNEEVSKRADDDHSFWRQKSEIFSAYFIYKFTIQIRLRSQKAIKWLQFSTEYR